MNYVVSLTGGVGSGKSTVSDIFMDLGIDVVDADVIAHQISQPGQKGYKEIIREFGTSYLSQDKTVDRKKLGDFVFSNPTALKRLESLLHPIIKDTMFLQVNASNSPYVILSIPLLFEKEQSIKPDRILVIDCKPSTQINRVITRSNMTTLEVARILKNQVSRIKRLNLSNDVISNDGPIGDLFYKVKILLFFLYPQNWVYKDLALLYLRTKQVPLIL